jgi:flagellar biogenesis protein FliO
MEIKLYVKDTPMLILFGMLFTIIFGLWLIKRVISYKTSHKSKYYFFLDNLSLIAGVVVGVGLLFIAFFL